MIIAFITGLFFGLFLFICDGVIAHIYAYPYATMLLCWYILCIFFRRPPHLLIPLFILLGCESSLYYERFGLTWIYLVPITVLILRLKQTVNFAQLVPYSALIASLILREFILVPWLTHGPIWGRYTGYMICGNVIVMVLMRHFIIPLTVPRTR